MTLETIRKMSRDEIIAHPVLRAIFSPEGLRQQIAAHKARAALALTKIERIKEEIKTLKLKSENAILESRKRHHPRLPAEPPRNVPLSDADVQKLYDRMGRREL